MNIWLLMKHRINKFDVRKWPSDEATVEGAYFNKATPFAIAKAKNKRSTYLYKVKKITVKGN